MNIIKKLINMLRINAKNMLLYGLQAPRAGERIWVDPKEIKKKLPRKIREIYFGTSHVPSGSVVDGDWDKEFITIESDRTFIACWQHWVNGIPWEQTDRYQRMLQLIKERGEVDGCANISDIILRYKKLDRVFEKIREEGRVQTVEEITRKKRIFAHGRGEIKIFIDRHGSPLHGCGGGHRLAIAKILGLSIIPAKLGAIHPHGVRFLNSYRKSLIFKHKVL